MTKPTLPRILGPNLGCPEVLSPQDLYNGGFALLLAAAVDADNPAQGLSLYAVPSFQDEGASFALYMEGVSGQGTPPREVEGDELPDSIERVEETRLLTSTTLRTDILEGKARFWVIRVKTAVLLPDRHLRQVSEKQRSTLFDLELRRNNECIHWVPHALCLRVPSTRVQFVHLTDLHLAERNDLWASEVHSTLQRVPGQEAQEFVNFNERARRFILWANSAADNGELDFVLALGDLVDFVEQGITESHRAANNWQLFLEIITGRGNEAKFGNPGLKVPVFTTTGNHDWRPNPYPPERNPSIFGLEANRLGQLDYLYRDSSEAVGKRVTEVHQRLVTEGSPILARSWWHSVVGVGLRGLIVFWDRVTTRLLAWANSNVRLWFYALGAALLGGSGLTGYFTASKPAMNKLSSPAVHHLFIASLVAVALYAGLLVGIAIGRDWLGSKLRRLVESLIAIESSVGGLRDYFLRVNPYFNYAFRLQNCYFVVLDTGHDCLTAQSFWDEGGKKIQRLKVEDNIIGGSPETMGFYPPNDYFPYSQIAWLERVLESISLQHDGQRAGEPRRCRVFVGLHAPPANLSVDDRKRADGAVQENGGAPVVLPNRPALLGGYNACYGGINHYLSQFYYLCLGVREENPAEPWGCGVDVALAGHAHWRLEFKLQRPAGAPGQSWSPVLCYGDLSHNVVQNPGQPDGWWGPLLLQTAACGPPNYLSNGQSFAETPYFRAISVEPNMSVRGLEQRQL